MKGFLYSILALVALACVCVVTCPDRETHSDALKDLLNKALVAEISESGDLEDDTGIAAFISMLGNSVGGAVIDNVLTVDNYFVCSVGRIPMDGSSSQIVSFGIMNHVFTISEDTALEAAENML